MVEVDLQAMSEDDLNELLAEAKAEKARRLQPGQARLANHPGVSRRGNPVTAITVGPDPLNPGQWVMAMTDVTSMADRLFSCEPGDLAELDY